MRIVARVGRNKSKKPAEKSRNSKSSKANGYKRTAKRSAFFKSANWYANAALAIGVSAKAAAGAS